MAFNGGYPEFVNLLSSEQDGHIVILEIAGKEYRKHHTDSYIDDAIDLAKFWKSEERTHERIVHLREWLRENEQHGHHIPIAGLKSKTACKKFVDQVINADLEYAPEGDKEEALKRNKQIFA